MTQVQFLFDFGSPNAYFAHKVIPEIERRTGAKFEYVPVLLGGVFKLTNNKPPMIQFNGIKNKLDYDRLEINRFVTRHRLTAFRFNAHFPVNTLKIMRAAVAAQAEGVLARYVDAVFRAMWEDSQKMDDPDVIRPVLVEAGLDADKLLALSESHDVKEQLMRNTADAVERGVFGSPSFFVGSELYFGKDRLREVEEEILASGA